MADLARLSNGNCLPIGRQIAEGGEGRIHEVANAPNSLVKLYHNPVDDQTHRKLIAMVQIRTASLESAAAWPIDLVYSTKGSCIGFVMPRMDGPGIIYKLSHPAEQRISFSNVEYRYIVHVAMNIMRAAAVLHASDCVIGDVNDSNIYVLQDGTIRFIDVDSFQIRFRGEVFPCNVGTPIYTPPELQGSRFREVLRTPEHDIFGLAVLVFQLLVQGCHPFAGIPSDGRARTIEEAIKEGLYAHSHRLRNKVQPPPDRLSPRALGEVAGLFERSFIGRPRPTAAEWMNALDRVRSSLRPCPKNPRHFFLPSNDSCPHCKLSRDPFPQSAGAHGPGEDLGAVSIAELIRQAANLPRVRPLAQRCQEPAVLSYERTVPTKPADFPNGPTVPPSGGTRVATAGGLFLAGGLAIILFSPAAGAALALTAIALFLVAGLQIKAAARKQAEAEAELAYRQAVAMRAYDPLRRNALAAVARLESIEARGQSIEQDGIDALSRLAGEISQLRIWLLNAENRFQTELRNADRTYRNQRIMEHLQRQFIAHASIPEIGPSRKATLASFGIETAADVDKRIILRIPGFGPHLTERLLVWRRACEQRYVANADLRTPADWLQRVRQKHSADAAEKAARLRELLTEYRNVCSSYDRQIHDVALELDLARRECRSAIRAIQSN